MFSYNNVIAQELNYIFLGKPINTEIKQHFSTWPWARKEISKENVQAIEPLVLNSKPGKPSFKSKRKNN